MTKHAHEHGRDSDAEYHCVILSIHAFVLFFFTLFVLFSLNLPKTKTKSHVISIPAISFPVIRCVTRRSHNSRIKETWY